MNEKSEIAILVAVSIVSSLLLYLPFALNVHAILGVQLPATGITVIERYYDGPLYAVVSKTFYTQNANIYSALGLPAAYYAAHLPGYPSVIWLFSLVTAPLTAMVVANLAISAGAVVTFYAFTTRFKLVHDPFSSSLLFLFFPPRWFLYRSVGASEPLFMLVSTDALRFEKRCAGQGDALRRRGFADTDMGRAQFFRAARFLALE